MYSRLTVTSFCQRFSHLPFLPSNGTPSQTVSSITSQIIYIAFYNIALSVGLMVLLCLCPALLSYIKRSSDMEGGRGRGTARLYLSQGKCLGIFSREARVWPPDYLRAVFQVAAISWQRREIFTLSCLGPVSVPLPKKNQQQNNKLSTEFCDSN